MSRFPFLQDCQAASLRPREMYGFPARSPIIIGLLLFCALVSSAFAAEPTPPLLDLQQSLKQQIQDLRPTFVGIFQVPQQTGTPSNTNPLADWQAGRPGALLPARLGGGTIIHIDDQQRSIRILTHSSLVTTFENGASRQAPLVVLSSASNTPLPSRVIASDPVSKLAILEVVAPAQMDFHTLKSALAQASPYPQPGTFLLLFSDPIGLAKEGSCSSKPTFIKRFGHNTQILSSALLYLNSTVNSAWYEGWPEPGLVGSPLFDTDQHLIGICAEPDDSAFAGRGVPVICLTPSLQRVLDDLQRGWEVEYGFLGLGTHAASEELLANIAKDASPDSTPFTGGVQIAGVPVNSPGALAELQIGDVILDVESQPVRSPDEFHAAIAAFPPGITITLRIWKRDTHSFGNVAVTTAKLPQLNDSGMVFTERRFPRWRGLNIGFPTPVIGASGSPELKFQPGVLIQNVKAGSPAANAGLKPGDIITQVGERPVVTPAEFHEAVADWTGDTPLAIAGRPSEVYVTDR